MILGVGCDMVRRERLRRPLGNSRFVERIFSPEEQDALRASSDPVTFAAGRWAAKEAVVKALGCGFSGCPPRAVSVVADERGVPTVHLVEEGEKYLQRVIKIHLSITHDGEYAMAFAVAEGKAACEK